MRKTLLAALVSIWLVACGGSKAVMNKDITHVDKKETLKKGEYYQFEITLEDKMSAIAVAGEWRVSEGGDRTVSVFVMDEENFLKFEKDQPFKKQYESGAKINDTFKIRLLNQFRSEKTMYYLVFDNPSEDDDKKIEFKLDLDYEWSEGTKE